MGPVASIAECLFRNRRISWGEVFCAVIHKEVGQLAENTVSYLPAYLIHIYQENRVLTLEEEIKFTALQRADQLEDPGSESEEEEEEEGPPNVTPGAYEDPESYEEDWEGCRVIPGTRVLGLRRVVQEGPEQEADQEKSVAPYEFKYKEGYRSEAPSDEDDYLNNRAKWGTA